MVKTSKGLILKTAVIDGIHEMLTLPMWWYTTGASEMFVYVARSIKESVRYFGVDVWAKNLFVPMYGDESFTGRVLSFLVRFVVILFRSLGVALWIIVAIALTIVYLMILPIALIGFFAHLIGMVI